VKIMLYAVNRKYSASLSKPARRGRRTETGNWVFIQTYSAFVFFYRDKTCTEKVPQVLSIFSNCQRFVGLSRST
jgi:hypothetical protein